MPRSSPSLPGEVRRTLRKFGADVRDARRRRRIPTAVLAERAFISRPTLLRVEHGDPAVSLGIYATVLWALGMGDRLAELADVRRDRVGLTLDEERLPQRIVARRGRRAPHRTKGP